MYTILHILFLIAFIYLSVNIAYLLIVSIAGLLYRKKSFEYSSEKKRIAILITSYREDEVIVNTVRSATEHNYPSDKFDVFLAADHLHGSTITALRKLNAHINEVEFPVGSKARSLNFLLNKIDPVRYDIALVLDGDNIMMPGFLEKINTAFQKGYKAVQGHRAAKNKNTAVAILDGISEEINNHLFRKAQRAAGFSSSLIGSGMAFEFSTLKNIYNKPGILDNPACDREVDFEMMKSEITIEYLDDAVLLDEKVSHRDVFENQRRRWLESQLSHLKLFFSKEEHVRRKTKDYWNKLFINLIPPRIFFAGIFLLIFVICTIQYFPGPSRPGPSRCRGFPATPGPPARWNRPARARAPRMPRRCPTARRGRSASRSSSPGGRPEGTAARPALSRRTSRSRHPPRRASHTVRRPASR
jgi:cellulose synthase/poly-beta-1,6-N-acetylglucosamine synthase-like glycosyltransferase